MTDTAWPAGRNRRGPLSSILKWVGWLGFLPAIISLTRQGAAAFEVGLRPVVENLIAYYDAVLAPVLGFLNGVLAVFDVPFRITPYLADLVIVFGTLFVPFLVVSLRSAIASGRQRRLLAVGFHLVAFLFFLALAGWLAVLASLMGDRHAPIRMVLGPLFVAGGFASWVVLLPIVHRAVRWNALWAQGAIILALILSLSAALDEGSSLAGAAGVSGLVSLVSSLATYMGGRRIDSARELWQMLGYFFAPGGIMHAVLIIYVAAGVGLLFGAQAPSAG